MVEDRPEIFNTDQGCRFTGEELTGVLNDLGMQDDMDGRSRAFDNVFVERLWRSPKYEKVHRREYAGLADARRRFATYITLYNDRRPNSSLDGQTPAEAHGQPTLQAA